MDVSDSLYVGAILTGVAIFMLGFGVLYSSDQFTGTPTDASPTYRVGVDGDRYHMAAGDLETLCLGQDCVPPIESPRYTSATAADRWLEPGDAVIGLTYNGATYAFPLRILQYHQVLNTKIAGDPLTVTYSPHAAHHAVFPGRVADTTTTFGTTGQLYRGTPVLYDRATGTHWSQFSHEAIRGPQVPATLPTIAAHVTRWELWKQAHPTTLVLSRNTSIYNTSRYADDGYYSYRNDPDAPVSLEDDTLPAKDLVHGLRIGDHAAAYRDVHVRDLDLITDTVGGVPVAIVQDQETGIIRAFHRSHRGRDLTLTLANNTLVDDRSGSTWRPDGTPIAGPIDAGLQPLPLHRGYWFAWHLFHPETTVYEPA